MRGYVREARGPRASPLRGVALVSDFFYPKVGGVELHVLSLARGLAERGISVSVVTRRYGALECDAWAAAEGFSLLEAGRPSALFDRAVRAYAHTTLPIAVYYLPLLPIPGGVVYPSFVLEFWLLASILRRRPADVVHVHQSYSTLSLTTALTCRVLGVPAVFTDHSMGRGDYWYELLLSVPRNIALCACDRVICVTAESLRNLSCDRFVAIPSQPSYGPGKVRIIPNAVEPWHFEPPASWACKPTGKVTIVVAQRLTFRKGTHVLIDVARRISSLDCVCLNILGNGEYMPELERLRDELSGAPLELNLVGEKPNRVVAEYLRAAHIVLIPSLTESFSIFLAEGIAQGCIPVVTRCGGTESIMREVYGDLLGGGGGEGCDPESFSRRSAPAPSEAAEEADVVEANRAGGDYVTGEAAETTGSGGAEEASFTSTEANASELFPSSISAMLVPQSTDAIVAALLRAISVVKNGRVDPVVIQAASLRISEKYSVERFTASTAEVYEGILRDRAGSGLQSPGLSLANFALFAKSCLTARTACYALNIGILFVYSLALAVYALLLGLSHFFYPLGFPLPCSRVHSARGRTRPTRRNFRAAFVKQPCCTPGRVNLASTFGSTQA